MRREFKVKNFHSLCWFAFVAAVAAFASPSSSSSSWNTRLITTLFLLFTRKSPPPPLQPLPPPLTGRRLLTLKCPDLCSASEQPFCNRIKTACYQHSVFCIFHLNSHFCLSLLLLTLSSCFVSVLSASASICISGRMS